MPKYYGHKPSWKQNYSGGGATRATSAPVLNMERSPSGVHTFSSDVYNPPATNSSGRYRGNSVPASGAYTWMTPAAKRMLQMKQRLAGMATKANLAMAFAEAVASDYDWDDFMQGDLPPPFDWLNTPDELKGLVPSKRQSAKTIGETKAAAGFDPATAFFLPVQSVPDPFTVLIPFPNNGSAWAVFAINGPSMALHFAEEKAHPNLHKHQWDHFYWGMAGGSTPTHDDTSPVGYMLTDTYKQFGAYPILISGYPNGSNVDLFPNIARPDVLVTYGAKTEAENVAWADAQRLTMSQWMPVPEPYIHTTNRQAELINFAKQVFGQQRVDNPPSVDTKPSTGSAVTVPPKGPVIVRPGEPPHPPAAGQKEKKGKVGFGLLQAAQKIFHAVTEYGDLVDALFEALPKNKQCKGAKSLQAKTLCLFAHAQDIDIGDAIVNIAWNQFEDYVIGKGLFGVNAKAAKARGDRYAFRTLNSANGFGGVDDLGELYGDFSKSYVNPSKDKLKSYLTDRFGI